MSKNKSLYRNIIQVIFLLLFAFLAFNGKMQLWIIVFGIGLLISLIWGRIYCGWICPINTVLRTKKYIYNKMNIKELDTPNFVKHLFIRWVILFLFVFTMIISRRLNVQINMILYVLIAAFILSLFYDEEMWHKYLCPYGALLSFTNKANSKKLEINNELCSQCGLCAENCPNNIIIINKEEQTISNKECLYCFKCQDVCQFNAISYNKESI